MAALDGWHAKNTARDYYRGNRENVEAFTLFVLKHASVDSMAIDGPTPEEAKKAVDANLHRWQNIQIVFEAVLVHNRIDIKAERVLCDDIWLLGAELNRAFLAHGVKHLGFALEALNNKQGGI